MRQSLVEIGGDTLSGQIPRAFDFVALPRPILFRVFPTVPAVQSPVLEGTKIAKCAGVGKFEGNDIVLVVEGLTTGTSLHGRGRVQGV